MSDFIADFTAGFSARHVGVAQALQRAFAPATGFAPADIKARAADGAATGPVGFSPQAPRPKHFEPADRATNPTAGWDPFDAAGGSAEPGDGRPRTGSHDDAARAAGYAEGLAAGHVEAREALARDRGLVDALVAAFAEDRAARQHHDRGRIAQQLRQAVLLLVTRLVGEIGVPTDILIARIDAAAALITDTAEQAVLRVHPDDVVLLDGRLPAAVFAVGDSSMTRGSFALESASTIVEDGPEAWIEQLAQAIDRVALPPA